MKKKYSDEEIVEALKHTKGNKEQAARLIGMSSGNIWSRMNNSKKIQRLCKDLFKEFKFTEEEVEESLHKCKGGLKKMAKDLQCSVPYVKKLIEKYNLSEIFVEYAKKNPSNTKYHEIELYDDEIKKVIPGSQGLYSNIASKLNVSRGRVMTAIKNNPELQKMLDAENENRIDLTETALFEAIDEDHDINAIKFHLKCKAKHRGYEEQGQTQTAIQVNLTLPKDLKEEDL